MILRGLVAAAVFLLAGCASHRLDTRVIFPTASVNGHPVRMALDTGSSSTVLFASRAKRLGLKYAELPEPTQVMINEQTFTAPIPVFRFPWMYRLAFIVMKGFKADGLVGWPEVRDNILVFDADRRTVRAVDQLPPETAGWLKLKVVPARWLLLEIPLADGKKAIMEVDSGSPYGVDLPPGQWKQWKAAHPKSRVTSHVGGVLSFGIHVVHAAWADEIKFGPLTLTDVAVDTMPAGQGAFIQRQSPSTKEVYSIGMYALRRMDLIVDGKNGFAYLHPRPPPGPPYPGVKRPRASNVSAHAPGASRNWSVSDNVRVRADSLFVLSGNGKWNKHDFAGAMADYSRALEINANNAEAHARRGACRQIKGDFSGAMSDYDKLIQLNPEGADWERVYRQTLLWRLGRKPEDFSKTLAGCREGWTKTLGLFLVEKLDEKALLAAAEKSDGETVSEQKSLTFFYVGMMCLSRGDKAGARDDFRKYRAAASKGDDEYQFAGAELERLAAERPESK
jgi:hypothetical protein